MNNRLLALILLVLGLAAAPALAQTTTAKAADPAYVDVDVATVASTPVVVAKGAELNDGDRALLEDSVRDLEQPGKAFPTRYVIVADTPSGESLDQMARSLRRDVAEKVGGIDNIDAVVLLAPRGIGISADAFQAEVDDALTQERSALMDHTAQGAVNVVNRLQQADANAALELGEKAPDKGGVAPWVWIVGGVVIALGIVAMIFARRAAARGERAKEEAESAAAGTPDGDSPES